MKLDADEGQFKIRDGRQKVSKADASDPAYTANLKYTGIAGLELHMGASRKVSRHAEMPFMKLNGKFRLI